MEPGTWEFGTLELAHLEALWNLEPGTWNSPETFGMVSDNVVSEGYVTDVMEHLRGEAVSLASVGTWNSRTENLARAHVDRPLRPLMPRGR